MSEFVIEARGLSKYFGTKPAVDSVDLKVPKGSVYGLLGRNGSGKSTIIKMLLGLLPPTRGSSTVLGRDSRKLDPRTRTRIGYMPEGHPLYPWMRTAAAGRFVAGFYEGWNADIFAGLLDHFGLEPKQRVRQLSRGQRAQLALAIALAQEPELLIMDDPTLGLDPVVRREFVESIVELIQAGGRTVLFSTHQLGDVERVADRIAIVDGGVLRADCSVDTFRRRVKRVHLVYAGAPPELPEIPGLLRTAIGEREITVTVAGFDDSVVERLEKTKPESLEVIDLGLEDAFVDYTSRGSRRRMAAVFLGEDKANKKER